MRKKTIGWVLLFLAGAAIVGAMAFALTTFSMLDVNKLNTLKQSTVLLDRQDQQAARLSGSENRIVIALNDIPFDVQHAFIAAEDARFYRHWGIDVYRIGGALWSNVQSRDYGQGASTITQQLIKLTHLTNTKTLKRKAQEALLALRLEMLMDKDQILEAYLNTVYFGAGAYGIEAASQVYFGIPARELTLGQGALLAGVIKSPTNNAPHLNLDNALKRRALVLRSMVDEGYITQDEADAAEAEPVTIIDRSEKRGQYAWYVEQAADEAEAILDIDREELLSGGYRLYTALDPALQSVAEALYLDPANFPSDAADGTAAQSALVAASNENGEILALIGGREYAVERGLNRASGIKRQPGSAFKPVSVFAAAVDRFGYLPTSFIDDTQRDFGGGYQPGNVGGHYNGLVTVRAALSRSLNVATVDLLSRTSVQAAYQYAEAAGIPLVKGDQNLSMALGSLTEGVSPMALNGAYAPLANGGQAVTPHLIRRIVDAEGETVYEFYAEPRQVLSPISARLITDMLITTAKTGTARALGGLPFPVAGKTGTNGMTGGGNRDVWTVAYTPSMAVTVWMGFDQPSATRKLPDSVSGSGLPARLAATFLEKANEAAKGGATSVAGGAFPLPDGLTEVLIDKRALDLRHKAMLVAELTPRAHMISELFPASLAPTSVSDVWKAPSRVFDLMAERVEGGTMLSFTSVDDFALYRVYRTRDGGANLIAEISGATGDELRVIDFEDHGEPGYYVVGVEKELLAEGIELASPPSKVIYAARRLNWDEAPEAPEEVPEEEPLFS